jgi:hypothetical protein
LISQQRRLGRWFPSKIINTEATAEHRVDLVV